MSLFKVSLGNLDFCQANNVVNLPLFEPRLEISRGPIFVIIAVGVVLILTVNTASLSLRLLASSDRVICDLGGFFCFFNNTVYPAN